MVLRIAARFPKEANSTRHNNTCRSPDLVGVVPLRIILDVEDQRVRDEQLQARFVAVADLGVASPGRPSSFGCRKKLNRIKFKKKTKRNRRREKKNAMNRKHYY